MEQRPRAGGWGGVYLAFCDFPRRFPEERGPGREEVLLRVLLQAAVAAAHRAAPRHVRTKTPPLSAPRGDQTPLNPPRQITETPHRHLRRGCFDAVVESSTFVKQNEEESGGSGSSRPPPPLNGSNLD